MQAENQVDCLLIGQLEIAHKLFLSIILSADSQAAQFSLKVDKLKSTKK